MRLNKSKQLANVLLGIFVLHCIVTKRSKQVFLFSLKENIYKQRFNEARKHAFKQVFKHALNCRLKAQYEKASNFFQQILKIQKKYICNLYRQMQANESTNYLRNELFTKTQLCHVPVKSPFQKNSLHRGPKANA